MHCQVCRFSQSRPPDFYSTDWMPLPVVSDFEWFGPFFAPIAPIVSPPTELRTFREHLAELFVVLLVGLLPCLELQAKHISNALNAPFLFPVSVFTFLLLHNPIQMAQLIRVVPGWWVVYYGLLCFKQTLKLKYIVETKFVVIECRCVESTKNARTERKTETGKKQKQRKVQLNGSLSLHC